MVTTITMIPRLITSLTITRNNRRKNTVLLTQVYIHFHISSRPREMVSAEGRLLLADGENESFPHKARHLSKI